MRKPCAVIATLRLLCSGAIVGVATGHIVVADLQISTQIEWLSAVAGAVVAAIALRLTRSA